MKITIEKKLLDETLEIVSRYSDPINSLFAFRCILVKVENEYVTFQASNGIVSIIKKIDVDDVNVKVEEPGEFLISSTIFKTVIKKLNGSILLKQEFRNTLDVIQENYSYSLTTVPATSFPKIDQMFNVKKFEINTDEFRKAVRCVQFAASTDNSLIYKCINFKFKNNLLNLTATDTYRLANYSIKVNNLEDDFDVSVNSKDVKDLIPSDAPKKVLLLYNDIKIGIEYKNTQIISRIVDLPYRNVETLFNEFKNAYKITINKEELIDLINKVWIGSFDKQNRIELSINHSEITAISNVSEIGNSVAKTSNFKLEGKSLEIDLNYNFIKDALSVYEGEIYIFIDEAIKKILILSKSNEKTKQLITPIRRR